jgi:hypothetical protein
MALVAVRWAFVVNILNLESNDLACVQMRGTENGS